jgi:flagellar M-ring protein FliF
LTVAVLVGDREISAPDGSITYQPRTPEELRRMEALVANAVGVSPERGDLISVVSAPFVVEPLPVIDDPFDFTGLAMAAQRPVVALAGLGVALFLSMQILGTLKTMGPGRGAPALAARAEPQRAIPAAAKRDELPPAPAQVTVTDPEMAARVLRSWMQEV